MKKGLMILILGALVLGIVFTNFVVAQNEVSFCCEKTESGAWCQNELEENCDDNFRKVPTSCEATSYCSLGCCYDSQEGTCMENTPQKVCGNTNGVWSGDSAECEIPQCDLGCCLIGDQAAFVTQTRCKRLSSLYGLEIDYRSNINSEVQCIASATSEVEGACVFEKDFVKTCRFISKKECIEMGAGVSGSGNRTSSTDVSFHEGYLCSSESLGVDCGPTKQTKCVEDRDEVYFVDSCGNLANIYDSSKEQDKEYWSKIYIKDESCGVGLSNADSAVCGSCDYFLGSTCRNFQRGEDRVRPNIGDNICRDLACEYEGEEYEHGETWCADSKGREDSLPGSRDFRLVCYNGEVTVEPCQEYRNYVCLESEVNGFSAAACVVNKWQGCPEQVNQEDCENIDRRDCQWIGEKCVPSNAPGFDFWNPDGIATQECSKGNKQCIVKYEKKLGGKKCVSACECIEPGWEQSMNEICISLGDCGTSVNYIGVEGYQSKAAVTREDFDEGGGDGGGGGIFG